MDTEVIKTLIEVVDTGSFSNAASRLNVAQTTVSARIKSLEERIGKKLLVRERNGVRLTSAGERLMTSASSFVHLGERMKRVAQNTSAHGALSVAVDHSLPTDYLARWINALQRGRPELYIRAFTLNPNEISDGISRADIDVALVHSAPSRTGVRSELLAEETLVFLSADSRTRSVIDPGFVYIDWGEEFESEFYKFFGNIPTPRVHVNSGQVAVRYAALKGGGGYGRLGAARDYIDKGMLQVIPEMPSFPYPLRAIHACDGNQDMIKFSLGCLRKALSIS
ncbi:DNA-binding transcriptional LysR family regulator [Limimaricola soesokkakensis]|uniref:DNA-binding transcriptional LysR family regulator n=1 Tax=Limimaricola soesokkakensis TaxID=1343159 RepID=A0A1X7A5U2_9RHOB|nr:LysR family transcriptional regulator [Limimaricola soesokkakensis]PSK80467.1 DNA-binding transcriptional LysR family regulator [Limimaricola soesokkakensis]SLN71449.1 HTH-type transcriptional activator AllS [Limimaricola soesokkakensis]